MRRRSRPQGPPHSPVHGAEASAKEAGPIAEGARAGLNYERHDVSHHHADSARLRFLADVQALQGEPRSRAEEAREVPRHLKENAEQIEVGTKNMHITWITGDAL